MPYSSVNELPPAAKKYSPRCQRAFMHAFNSAHADNGESKAFAIAHAAAQRCQEAKSLDVLDKPKSDFRIFSAALEPIPSDDGKKRLRTIASSTVEDLGGDEISPKALQQMASTAKGMTIFRNHSYKVPDDILGHVESAQITQSGIDGNGKPIMDLVLDVIVRDDNKSLETYGAVQSGVKLGTSIGAKIIESGATRKENGGYLFDDLRLLEASIVGIPQNPRSWVQYALKAWESSIAETEEAEETNEEFHTSADSSVTLTLPEGTTTITNGATTSNVEIVAKEADPPEPEAEPKEDEANEQSEDEAPAESEDENVTADADPDVLKDEAVESDESPAQEVGETVPEHAEEATDESVVADTVKQSAMVLADLVKNLSGENVNLRKALDEATARADEATRRAKDAEANTRAAMQIVQDLHDTPLARQAVFAEKLADANQRFSGMYSPSVIKLLENPDES